MGNGIAGNSAISAIRKFDKDASLTLVSDEEPPLYSPCAFYKYLSGEMEEQKLFLKTFDDYRKEGVEVVFGQKASEVDVKAREVLVGDRSIPFDKLVLATGSTAISLPIKGADKKGVFTFKTITDAEKISNYPARKVAVIGSGPIGLEAAISLREKGLEVSVVEILNRILPRLFDFDMGSIIRGILEAHGVNVFTEERATEILGNGVVKGLTTDKRHIECDVVIMAAGVRPNTELARQIGADIGDLRAIKTDDHMMTSVEDVYACGDCVESRDIITGKQTLSLLWHNAKRQGWIAGCNCVGRQNKFIGSFDAATVEVFGSRVASAGKSEASFSSRSDYDVVDKKMGSDYHRLIIENDRLVGMQLINKTERAGLVFSNILKKGSLTGLRQLTLNDRLLSARPWHHWMKQYLT